MNIIVNSTSMIPLYEQIVDQIKKLIISGELKENDALPSVRVLAKELKISALTVKKSYDFLESEGFISTIHGKGSYVSCSNLELMSEERRKEIEANFEKVIQKAKQYGLKDDELKQIFEMIMEDQHDTCQ